MTTRAVYKRTPDNTKITASDLLKDKPIFTISTDPSMLEIELTKGIDLEDGREDGDPVELDVVHDEDLYPLDDFHAFVCRKTGDYYFTRRLITYTTHNDPNFEIEPNSGQGDVITTYEKLQLLFGAPSDHFDEKKSDAAWYVKFSDGTFASIYNYKNGRNYLGQDGTPRQDITEWQIGGDITAPKRVKEALDNVGESK